MKTETLQHVIHRGALAKQQPAIEMFNDRKGWPLAKRLGYVCIAKLVGPVIIDPVGNRLGGDEFLGNGGEQIVYANKDNVVKLVWTSIDKDYTQVEENLEQYRQREQTCKNIMVDQWLDTEYNTIDFWHGYRAIVAHQARIHQIDSFKTIDELADFTKRFPNMRPDVANLTTNIRHLYTTTGLYPDILGPNNILLVRGRNKPSLLVVDTIPADAQRLAQPCLEDSTKTRREMIQEKLDLLYAASKP